VRGLVLEGGGAKGAFQIGAVRALYEHGYTFDGVAGTSIGAINGAIIVSKGWEACVELWSNISISQIIEADEVQFAKFFEGKMDMSAFRYFAKLFLSVAFRRGFKNKMLPLLQTAIKESDVRASKMDFGLQAFSLSDREPIECFIEDIPEGELHDYLLATAYFPAFRFERIKGKLFIDGGLYDNLPINLLVRRGYTEIIAIRTMSRMPRARVVDKTVKVHLIQPSEPLGRVYAFNQTSIQQNIKLGYYDAKRFIHGYLGKKYYIENISDTEFAEFFSTVYNKEAISQILKVNDKVKKTLFSYLKDSLGLDYSAKRGAIFIAFLEYIAAAKLEKFKVYTLKEFYNAVRNTTSTQPRGKLGRIFQALLKV
jgi:NTE family protein